MRTKIRTHPERRVTQNADVLAILDEGLVSHVGFIDGGTPFVIPMMYARLGNVLYLHGSAAGRLMSVIGNAEQICVTITLLDGIVLARSAFKHSMNYRSVVVFGKPQAVTEEAEKRRAFAALVEHVVPGRSGDTREASAAELEITGVIALDLDECSAKRRSGPPLETKSDETLSHWAGVIPAKLKFGQPEPDERTADTPLPNYLRNYDRDKGRSPTQ